MSTDLTYAGLRYLVQDLAMRSAREGDAIQEEANKLEEVARDVLRVAESIAAMEVAPATTAEMRDLSAVLRGATTAVGEYASAAHDTAKMADAADRQAQTTHGGIDEAVARSPEHAGKAGWYRQE